MNKYFKIISNVIFIIIVVILLGYFTLRLMNKVEIYNVSTGSMESKIHAGDYILILKKSNYKVGEVVTYSKNNYFITHRIVKINDEKIITKGDANNIEDEEIDRSEIIGKVVISGGILNFIINYKYALVSFFLTLYFISWYINKDKNKE